MKKAGIKTVIFLSLAIFLLRCGKDGSPSSRFSEQYRPQFHFSPQKGWMNDPNGLVYYKEEYHLFYQYYPDSTTWGPMHWGHAISTDLIHWKDLPIALYPDSLGYIFSGSVIVDENNTSGLQKGEEKPLVAFFTYHNMAYEKAGRTDRESQAMAYSLDKGRTWKKYEHNPVIANKGDVDFRDPKVFWHESSKHWVMALAVGDHLEIFTSSNLKKWEKSGEFGKHEGSHGGVWECPDLFPIKATDGTEKWVLIQNIGRGAIGGGSGTQYFVGHFDGKTFKNDNPPDKVLWFDYGADNYAGVTWSAAPNNRRIFIGWLSNWDDYATKVPTQNWRSGMTLPRELSLEKTKEGYRLFQNPVKETEVLRNKSFVVSESFDDSLMSESKSVLKEVNLIFDLSESKAKEVGFKIGNSKNEFLTVGYDKATQTFFIDRIHAGKSDFSKLFARRQNAPYKAGKTLTVKALIDVASVEVFVDNGKLAMTDLFFPNEDFTNLYFYGKEGKTELIESVVYELNSTKKTKQP
jgi:fructan beta-fructosidase